MRTRVRFFSGDGGPGFSCQPPQKPNRRRNGEQQAFVRAAVREDGDSEAEDDGVLDRGTAGNSGKRAKQHGSADRGSCSAPVAVDPITGDAEFKGGEGATEEGPARGHPRAQHPGDGRTHRCGTEQHADPGRPEELAEGEHQALRGRIDGGVGGQPVDVERVEAGPHGVGGIGETSVGEGIAHQQVTVFVVNAGNWYRKQGKNRYANGEHRKEQKKYGKGGSRSEAADRCLNGAQRTLKPALCEKRYRKKNDRNEQRSFQGGVRLECRQEICERTEHGKLAHLSGSNLAQHN